MDERRYRHERRVLQIVIAIAACVPVFAGSMGMITGTRYYTAVDPSLDSHVRYLSGLLFGVGISFWAMVPQIERHTTVVRVLTFMVVMGGLSRLAAAIMVATPALPMQLAIGMELVITPLLCLWQGRIARLCVRT